MSKRLDKRRMPESENDSDPNANDETAQETASNGGTRWDDFQQRSQTVQNRRWTCRKSLAVCCTHAESLPPAR